MKNRVRIMRRALFPLSLGIVLFSGCARVQPWQRERLAEPIMIFDKDGIEKGIREHHLDYREGSAGGTGSQSGGCGCG
jgi:hypothetical protein